MVQTDRVYLIYLNESKPDIENGICIDFCSSQLYKTDLGHIYTEKNDSLNLLNFFKVSGCNQFILATFK